MDEAPCIMLPVCWMSGGSFWQLLWSPLSRKIATGGLLRDSSHALNVPMLQRQRCSTLTTTVVGMSSILCLCLHVHNISNLPPYQLFTRAICAQPLLPGIYQKHFSSWGNNNSNIQPQSIDVIRNRLNSSAMMSSLIFKCKAVRVCSLMRNFVAQTITLANKSMKCAYFHYIDLYVIRNGY